jgi:hypothetical protein
LLVEMSCFRDVIIGHERTLLLVDSFECVCVVGTPGWWGGTESKFQNSTPHTGRLPLLAEDDCRRRSRP